MPRDIYIRKPFTEERKIKISKTWFKKGLIPWNKGKAHSLEAREKMKLAKINYIPWIKGKHHSEESKRKMSEARKGMIPGNKGKPCSGEMKIKLSKMFRGISRSPNTVFKKGIIPWSKGKHIWKDKQHPLKGKHIWENKQHPAKGRLMSEEQKSKIRKTLTGKFRGEKSSRWQGGISTNPYPFNFNKELKELIRKRDNFKCQLCGCPQVENIRRLTVHHIDYNKDNLNHNNLIALCSCCNSKVNRKREYWMRYFQGLMEEKLW